MIDENRRQVHKHGGVHVVVAALQRYPSTPDMFHWGCGILLNLARDRGARERHMSSTYHPHGIHPHT